MKIDDLIRTYCPEGVKRVRLEEVCKTNMGEFVRKDKQNPNGKYPVYNGGSTNTGYYDEYNTAANKVIISARGAAGFVNYINVPFWAGNSCHVISVLDKDDLLEKYLYYILKNQEQDLINHQQKGGGVPAVSKKQIDSLLIPLPPLPIQQTIVSYLDKLTSLTAELEAELELQKKRYDFYRNRLLSFAPDSATQFDARLNSTTPVKWMKLGEVFEMRNGYTPSKNNPAFWEDGTIPWFRMEDIRENGRILSDAIQHITAEAVKGKGLFEADSFILATTATIGEHALLIADSLANQQFTNLKIRKSLKDSLLTKFVFYYMFVVDDFCKKHTNKSGFESVDMDALRNMPFPLPPLSEQERIVGILDKYETLVHNTQEGIPALIAAVKQKYEYYRERLLTF